jgi:hypothetical protein
MLIARKKGGQNNIESFLDFINFKFSWTWHVPSPAICIFPKSWHVPSFFVLKKRCFEKRPALIFIKTSSPEAVFKG